MGVPAFYRWLAEKYPLAVVDVIEEEPLEINGVPIPVDTSKPNPNSIEYDNLYLDMNGIIHPCFHPEDRPSPTSLDEVFQYIFNYIDRLFVIVRPRKLLLMAIDGVAPRAKMNQQRSRRFRASEDAADAAAEEERLYAEFEQEGRKLPPKKDSTLFDSNVITPGTQFMADLSRALQYYIRLRLNNDPGWRNIKVLLSDANVPGEGEHKIMSYIRLQRNLPGYDPNTRHCLYGLDADLIMLALATHEIHFSILREIVSPGQPERCFLCGRAGHFAADCEGKANRQPGNGGGDVVPKKPYQFLHIWIIREYLEYEMRIPNPPFQIDLERIIDDFIFMCFFVGNDFLPHMPTLEIHEGAINLLMAVYKKELRFLGGFLTDGCKLNLCRVERYMQALGIFEDKIFQKRARIRQRQAERIKREKSQAEKDDDSEPTSNHESFAAVSHFHMKDSRESLNIGQVGRVTSSLSGLGIQCNQSGKTRDKEPESRLEPEENYNEKELKYKVRQSLREKADVFNMGNLEVDKVRLGELGWRDRYYEHKFSAKSSEELEDVRRDVALKYTEGLCWVMQYYYEGVCSWQWYYPYYYAPFTSDLKGLGRFKIRFGQGTPFKPLNQLLGVLPAASSHALPKQYKELMAAPSSPIIDFYPNDFEVDMYGKRYTWQGIAKLPFIDDSRLLAEVAKIEHTLTEEEAQRNSVKCDMLFISVSHTLSPCIISLDDRCKQMTGAERAQVQEKIDPAASGGMNGYISLCDGDLCPPLFRSPIEGMKHIMNNKVISVIYKLPDVHKHSPRLPPGVTIPEKTITEEDLKPEPVLWHEDTGRKQFDNISYGGASTRILERQDDDEDDLEGDYLSGQRLSKAARRLVANRLHVQRQADKCNNSIPPPQPVDNAPPRQYLANQTNYANSPFRPSPSYIQPPPFYRPRFGPPPACDQTRPQFVGRGHNYPSRPPINQTRPGGAYFQRPKVVDQFSNMHPQGGYYNNAGFHKSSSSGSGGQSAFGRGRPTQSDRDRR